MPSSPTPAATYSTLKDQIQHILTEGSLQTRQATETEKVDTYWHVGDALHGHILHREGRADYGERIVANLAGDLNLGQVLLYDILRFRRAFPIFHAREQLAWTHYRLLTTRTTSIEQRRFYELRADEAGWSTRELEQQIKADLYRETRNRTGPSSIPTRWSIPS